MNEKTVNYVEKEMEFERNEERIKVSVKLVNIDKNEKIKDFLETMFKEIKKDLF